ncbi:AMP-binding protein [Paenibacillus sp. KN14-4R]|uniref:AMP-binding protein n=1 Tax=Paenibacillus sp. KN14-4R TaxID=3445773 RepID=UPI003F9F584A
MFIVNQSRFTLNDIQVKYDSRSYFSDFVAICVPKAEDILGFVFSVKNQGGSILILHPEMPLQVALEYANVSGCSKLIFGRELVVYNLNCPNQFTTIPSLFQLTSGTTGRPKIISRSWKEIDKEVVSLNNMFLNSNNDTPVILVPVSHSFGLITGVMTAIARGIEPIIVTEKNPKYSFKIIKSTHSPIVYGVPFLINLLHRLNREGINFNKIMTSGAPLVGDVLKQITNNFELWQQYGTSETGCISLKQNPNVPNNCGQVLSHLKVELVDLDGYQKIHVFTGSDAVETGDVGYFDEHFDLHVTGRFDDLINVSGQKVIPYVVEEVIRKIEGVLEVVVYRGKHVVMGECVKAKIVCKKGKEVTREIIREWCLLSLPEYQVPTVIEIVDELPRTMTGKINRKQIEWEDAKNETR